MSHLTFVNRKLFKISRINHMKKFVLITLVILGVALNARAQNKLKSKVRVNGLYTSTLDLALDSIGSKYHLHFVFDRDFISHLDLVAHYFNEPLKNVLNQVCSNNNLHYWVDADQTIYIIKEPQDVERLKKAQARMPDITQPKKYNSRQTQDSRLRTILKNRLNMLKFSPHLPVSTYQGGLLTKVQASRCHRPLLKYEIPI